MHVGRLLQSSRLQWAWRAAFLKHSQRGPQRAWRWTRSGGSPYRAVIFGMGGVLIPSPRSLAAGWEVQNRIPSGTLLKAFLSGGENGPWMKFMRGEMTMETFLREFGTLRSETSETRAPLGSFFSLLTSEQVAKQFPVMTEAITQIRAKGLRTAVLSNNFYLPNGQSFLPLDRKQFDVVVESCLEGICKPDPRIYQLCLERLGLQPAESIFLDDLGQNLQVAASLGVHTIKVNDPEVAVKELETLLGFTLRTVVPNTRPVRNTMEIHKDSLEKYLKDLLGTQTTGPLELLQFDHRQSSQTYYIRLADQQLVLRKKPPGTLLPSAHALEREFRVMKALAGAGVPVPRVLGLCEDPRIIGTPFYLMEYCPGLVYKDPTLPGLEPSRRRAIYTAMNRVLCKIHSVDFKATGLEDYGKHGDYIAHQVRTWIKQYRASETSTIPVMERLIAWLPLHLPRQQKIAVVHGDFRLDNLLFHPENTKVLAVCDWELSTLGDPLADVAYSCVAHYLPPEFPLLPGLGGRDLTQLGIPTAEEYSQMYCLHMGIPPVENWNFYMAFSFFRVAAVMQGVYKGSLTDITELPSKRAAEGDKDYVSFDGAFTYTGKYSAELATSSGLCLARELCRRLEQFVEQHVYPSDPELRGHQASVQRRTPSPLVKGLKEEAKAEGLWNLFLPLESDPEGKYGVGLTNVEYTHLCELMGTSLYAPEVPSLQFSEYTRNMELLVRYGTKKQKACWLVPLLEGKAYSCFAVMEPQVKPHVAFVAFGKPLVEEDTILADIARSPAETEQARLLTSSWMWQGIRLHAIAVIKMGVPSMAYQLMDHAMQALGAAGLSHDYPRAQFFAWAQVLRFADSPDEVHQAVVAKVELKRHI